jgi:hypothetical protein
MEENRGYIDFSGDLMSGKLYEIGILYDETPTVDVYNEFRDQEYYDYG